MLLNFPFIKSDYNTPKAVAKKQSVSNPVFGANTPQKLIKKIINTPNDKNVKLTFDEVAKIYNYLGYDVIMKRGSHAIVPVGNVNIPLIIPHKDKNIAPKDIRTLRLIITGDIEKAQKLQKV